MFGTTRRRQWSKKGNKLGSIRNLTDNKPEYTVSVDQLQSAQPGSIPQLSGKLTSKRIWAAQFMVDNLSYLIFVHLMRNPSQE